MAQRQQRPVKVMPVVSFKENTAVRELIAKVMALKTKGAVANLGKRIEMKRQEAEPNNELETLLKSNGFQTVCTED